MREHARTYVAWKQVAFQAEFLTLEPGGVGVYPMGNLQDQVLLFEAAYLRSKSREINMCVVAGFELPRQAVLRAGDVLAQRGRGRPWVHAIEIGQNGGVSRNEDLAVLWVGDREATARERGR